jgi:hypothetical protein
MDPNFDIESENSLDYKIGSFKENKTSSKIKKLRNAHNMGQSVMMKSTIKLHKKEKGDAVEAMI